jgi:hypothetical protein
MADWTPLRLEEMQDGLLGGAELSGQDLSRPRDVCVPAKTGAQTSGGDRVIL